MSSKIKELFGDRASDDALRRFVYGHDMGALPDTIGAFIKNVPDLVVQPVSEQEIIDLVTAARAERAPLVPRGGASAGLGGAVPAKAGIVVDFVRMDHIIEIDPTAGTATVEPGVIWSELQRALNAQDLDLPLYPTSALAATVGGWVAQGGAGIGSRGVGYLNKNIISVRAVLGDSSVRDFTGKDLELTYAMEGITGLITQITIDIVPLRPMTIELFAFPSAAAVQSFIQKSSPLDLWHINVQPPNFVALKNLATKANLPEEWIAFVVHVESASTASAVEKCARDTGGRSLSPAAATHEWGERLYPMRAKKFGPSLVASDVIVPTARFADFARKMASKFGDEFLFEGTLIGSDEIAVIGFMLADERKLSFTMLFANSLVVNEAAKKLGGRIFGSGMYLTPESESIFGKALLTRIVDFKKKTDPAGIMNPGKIMPPAYDPNSPVKLIAHAVASARGVAGIGGALGKLMTGQGTKKISDLPGTMEDEAFACVGCGFCRNVCTVFKPEPWEDNSPRGKWYLLKEYAKGNIKFDQAMATSINLCTTCKNCDMVCEISLHNAHEFMGVKPYLLDTKNFENTGLADVRKNVLNTGNFWGVPTEMAEWRTDDMRFSESGEIGYWPGCWSSVITKNSPQNAIHLMNAAGVEPVFLGNEQTCCGLYHILGGYQKDFKKRVKDNLELMNSRGVKTLVTSCPGCFATFEENYKNVAAELGIPCDIEFKHIVVYLDELIAAGKLSFPETTGTSVTYHDSCHVGRWFGHYEEPRNILAAIPGVELHEMEHNRDEALCCGLVGSFYSMPVVEHSAVARVSEAEKTGADYVITNCAGCAAQFNATSNAMGTHVRQKDLTDLAAEALGYEVYDATPAIAQFMQGAVEMLCTSCTTARIKR